LRGILFIVCDGLGDRPIKEFGNKTPLESASTPNLDRLAKEGATGRMLILGKDKVPESDEAHLTLFGYDLKKCYSGRGVFEVAGIGIDIAKDDIAWRANLGTVDENRVIIDRRCGRISSVREYAESLDGIEVKGVKFMVRPGTAYRMGIVMRGEGLSPKVGTNDPHRNGERLMEVKALDGSDEAKFTAEVMNEFLEKAYKILSDNPLNKERGGKGLPIGNCVLCRGASSAKAIEKFEEKYGMKAACIAGAALYRGIGRVLGMDVLEVKGATGIPSTDIGAKFDAGIRALGKYDFVFVHVKAADSLGEDGNCRGKREFIERIDVAAEKLLGVKETIVVTADHSTPCADKAHSADPVPLLIRGKGIKADATKEFGENACGKGSLGEFMAIGLMGKLMETRGCR